VGPNEGAPTVWAMEAKYILEGMLLWGGYPEVFLGRENQAVLNGLVEAFILRDASDLYSIKNPQAFRRILQLAASQVGNLTNFASWAEISGVSVNTVSRYLNILAESHVIRLVPPFVGGKRAEITSRPKVYFLDNGLRNSVFGGFSSIQGRPDVGTLMENLVFTELCKYTNPLLDSIHFWRSSSQAEVDFVLIKEGVMTCMEVKATVMKRPKVSRSLRSFIQAYGPDKAFVVNSGLEEELTVDSTPVSFIEGHDLAGRL